MNNKTLIANTKNYVKKQLANAEGGHDWFHIERVYRNALQIAKGEQVNLLVVKLGALLHDIADSKFYNGDETIGPRLAQNFLRAEGVEEKIITAVTNIIENISFKGGNFGTANDSIELQVVRDADRLDAIGAIGIARCFNYGGYKNRVLYDPNIPPNLHMSKEEYKTATSPTINHFYEKLLLLKDRMHTKTARDIAQKRHEYMQAYLSQFYKEWEGKG